MKLNKMKLKFSPSWECKVKRITQWAGHKYYKDICRKYILSIPGLFNSIFNSPDYIASYIDWLVKNKLKTMCIKIFTTWQIFDQIYFYMYKQLSIGQEFIILRATDSVIK
jgi:hypothetical protein